MAESFLFGIADSLMKKLASRAYEEASQVLGVYDDLREFKQTLSFIKSVLLDAEQKQEHNHELREWLRQIKRVLSDAENVFDEVECESLRNQVVKAYGTPKTKVAHFFSSSNPLVLRYRIAQKIKEIRKRLDRVAADRDKFGLERIDVDRRIVLRREMTYSYVVDSDVIGRGHDREKIVKLLMQHNPNCDDKSISVIPIVGIGGLGKTTLAKFVFNDRRITESFSLKLWVCVSDEFDIMQLVVKIIGSASEFVVADAPIGQNSLKDLDMELLTSHLRNKLVSQKFLLVLDDIWNEDRVKWVELRNLIQVGANGSKILVTTRNHAIASMMGTIPPHILGGLSLDDSMSLFIKWAFKEGEEEKYLNLVVIGRKIVEKCRGVPLAVRTLGSLLFSKLDIDEWEFVRDNEIWNLPQKKDDILHALKLSYDQMPSHLKQCVALFSLYPKDYKFHSSEVASLWGAVGLLSCPNKNKTFVEVANHYLCELMSRSFVHDFVKFGSAYCFKMHDLVHDLALYVAKEECLLVNSNIQNMPENVLHLSFSINDQLAESFTQKLLDLRTILFPAKGVGANSEALLNTWVSSHKYLRFLDISDSTCETLPQSIGRLKHLRHLSLGNNKKIKRLPDSICMLQNLESLCLSGCEELEALPKGLGKLISLQRLWITTKQIVLPQDDIASLSSLQGLSILHCHNLKSLLVGVTLPTLRTLTVNDCGNLKSLPLDINHFPQLETLTIINCDNLELSKGHEDRNFSLKLKFLCLQFFPQLEVLLPLLLQGSASTLQGLTISDCDKLDVLPECMSTLNFLKTFWVRNCPKLMSLPSDIHLLTALECLVIQGCPELRQKYQPQFVECWQKISHVKHIDIDNVPHLSE